MRDNPIGFKQMWSDPEINGRTFLQLTHLYFDTLIGKDQIKPFFDHASSVMHKLHATKYHLENYRRIEQENLVKCEALFKENPNNTYECFELIFELEGFLYQIKSSLDMLVKLLIPIIGPGRVKTHTFADKGDKLIDGLNQYKLQSGVRVDYTDDLIVLIRQTLSQDQLYQ